MHPARLLDQLTAAELWEWFLLYQDEPFGDTRADLRAWAHACLQWGARDVTLAWPYVPPEWSEEDIRAEMQRIERAQHEYRDDHYCD